MLILYTISVVCFCALVWAVFAIVRHIRIASSAAPTRSEATPIASAPATKPARAANPEHRQAS